MNRLKSYFKEKIEKKVDKAVLAEKETIDITAVTSPTFMGQWFYEVEKPKFKK